MANGHGYPAPLRAPNSLPGSKNDQDKFVVQGLSDFTKSDFRDPLTGNTHQREGSQKLQ